METLRLGVIFGGRSGEHEISLRSARSVIHELDKDKYEVIPIGISKSGQWLSGPETLERLEQGQLDPLEKVSLLPEPGNNTLYRRSRDGLLEAITNLDIVFPVLHGTFGEDGTVQGLLKLADIPFVGASILGSSAGMDKDVMKRLLRDASIPIPGFLVFDSSVYETTIDKNISAKITPTWPRTSTTWDPCMKPWANSLRLSPAISAPKPSGKKHWGRSTPTWGSSSTTWAISAAPKKSSRRRRIFIYNLWISFKKP